MPRKRSKTKKHREPLFPEWKYQYLRDGKSIPYDPIFDQIQNEDHWPKDISPDPWEAIHFEIYGAKEMWSRIRNDIDVEAFPYAHRIFDLGHRRGYVADGPVWFVPDEKGRLEPEGA